MHGGAQCVCYNMHIIVLYTLKSADVNSPVPVSVTPIPNSSQPTGSRNPIVIIPSTDPVPIPSSDPPSTESIPFSSTDPILSSIPSSSTTSSLTRDHVTTTESNTMTSSSSSSSSSESTDTVTTMSSTDDKRKPKRPTSGDNYDPAKTTPTQQLRPTPVPTPAVFGLKVSK